MKLFVLPYKRGSKAVKQIKERLNAPVLRLQNSKWRPKVTRAVINWGHTAPPLQLGNNVLNKPAAVSVAVNKLNALGALRAAGILTPEFTNSRQVAESWFNDDKTIVFCRTLLRSSGGKGIVIAKSARELVNAPLYTKRVPKKDEFRVHVFKGEVIDVVEKRLRRGLANEANRNSYVRNHDNGWVFAHDNVICPDAVKAIAIQAVNVLGLDFGAVDIGVSAKGAINVFEVNTAPGLENQQTITSYVNAFKNYKKKEEEKQNEKINRAIFWR